MSLVDFDPDDSAMTIDENWQNARETRVHARDPLIVELEDWGAATLKQLVKRLGWDVHTVKGHLAIMRRRGKIAPTGSDKHGHTLWGLS